MKQGSLHRRALICAAGSTWAFILILICFIRYESQSNISEVILFSLLSAVLTITIYFWIVGTKEYIEFAIEKVNLEHQDTSFPNEDVSEA